MNLNPYTLVVHLFAVVMAITVHEFAHAMSAYKAGDETAKRMGRLTLNPVDHFDPVGITMIVMTTIFGFGIGWGKPVPVNPANFRNPRWDDVKVSFWGPLSNILMAVASVLILKLFFRFLPDGLVDLLVTFILVNVGLAVFNMVPLPPLDGSHILAGLLPYEQSRAYARFASQYGMAVLVALLLIPIGNGSLIGIIIGPVIGIVNTFLFRML